jgi:hypothetical protein
VKGACSDGGGGGGGGTGPHLIVISLYIGSY